MNAAPASFFLLLTVVAAAADKPWPRTVRGESVEIPTPGLEGRAIYPAFPALWPRDGNKVLVTYKAGRGHTHDPGAEVVLIERDLLRGTQRELQRFTPPTPLLYQCAEPVGFADGSLALFLDTQRIGPEPRHYRAPMQWARSTDGRTFGPADVFPVVDGVGYGYPFEGRIVGSDTLVMLMTFGYLEGGRWSVDLLRTSDHGTTWRFVRNLSAEFNVPGFNEGSFLPHRDGFLVASRSYDLQARLHEVDREFRLRRQVNLTEASPWINGYIGRPRLFRHQDAMYLIGRNWTQPDPVPAPKGGAENPLGFPRAQQLCLFRLDPATLLPVSCWILDNAEEAAVSDGYYAVTATTDTGADARLHVITYKGLRGAPTRLLHLQFKWSELLAE